MVADVSTIISFGALVLIKLLTNPFLSYWLTHLKQCHGISVAFYFLNEVAHAVDSTFLQNSSIDALNTKQNDLDIRLFNRIKIAIVTFRFTFGMADCFIDGAEEYSSCLIQNISSNDHFIIRSIHTIGSKQISAVARTTDMRPFDGDLIVIILLV